MKPGDDAAVPFMEHVAALRNTAFRSVLAILLASVAVHTWRHPIIEFLLTPLGEAPPPLQFLSPLDPLFFVLKVDFTLGFLIALPLVIYFVWRFLAPATETPTWKVVVLISIAGALALVGAAYAYHVVVPIVLDFMNAIVIEGTIPAYTAHGYLNFLLSATTLLVFIFQIPLIIVLLSILNLLNPEIITRHRSHLYVGILATAAIITPTTDIITLALVAVPAMAVTELGVAVARLLRR